ncbi:hypothetical protein DFJ73DRAFT_765695 [Zopfochytrium polystomum]|nr:hypothetical protein DFJ73DRAFT_765695 [Zopfochytrium polystomum]
MTGKPIFGKFENMEKFGLTEIKIKENGDKGYDENELRINRTKKYFNKNIHKNFGIFCGIKSNEVVVDLDNKDEEFTAKKWFEEHLGKIEEINTLVTKTIRGGYHIYFKYDERFPKSTSNNMLHIDIKGQGYDVYVDKEIRSVTENELSKLEVIWNKEKMDYLRKDGMTETVGLE